MKFLITIFIFCAITPLTYSQDTIPAPNPKILLTRVDTVHSNTTDKIKEIRAIRIETKLNIDGILNEPEWSLAATSPHFVQIDPEQGKPVHFETKIKVLYNKVYLYVGIIALDTLGKKAIMATDFIRDFDITRHDLVSLAFDGFNDHRNAMSFLTDAYGVQKDLLSFDDLYYDINWDGLWTVRTNRTDSGWTAEIAIPWQTLRYPKSKDSIQSWGFNVYRNRRLSNEISAFSEFPHAYTSLRMNYAGKLTNLQPPPPKPNILFEPYFLTQYEHEQNIDKGIIDTGINNENTSVKVGGDLKWAINPNTVLDLTVNTDFAQADVDQQVNNTTQFSVFFPEKRQFFLENASLFGVSVQQTPDLAGGTMHLQPFNSRTIGLDSSGNPIPIIGGARLVHRSDKLNYGAIIMRQGNSGGYPFSDFFVGRLSQNFGELNRIGLMTTIKNDAHGSSVENTADAFLRFGKANSINSIFTHSYSTQTGKSGFAGAVQYFNSTNQWKIWWTESIVTKNFNPEMGFVSRTDVIGTTPGIFYYYRGKSLPLKKYLLALEPGFTPELYVQTSTGKLIEADYYIFPIWFNFKSGAYLGYGFIPTYQNLTAPFTTLDVTISVGEYRYTQQQIWFSSNPSKMLNMQIMYSWGTYYNGRLNTGDWKLQFAPLPHISLTGEFNRNRFFGVGELKTNSTVDLIVLQGRFALNPRIQLTAFYQKNTENSSNNYNIRFSWEYQPLSYIYLILNHQGFEPVNSKAVFEDNAIFKINYLKQF
jgi:Domain of unknown function (DUF5916)/Carbohydrate family 9 binding domain-like